MPEDEPAAPTGGVITDVTHYRRAFNPEERRALFTYHQVRAGLERLDGSAEQWERWMYGKRLHKTYRVDPGDPGGADALEWLHARLPPWPPWPPWNEDEEEDP